MNLCNQHQFDYHLTPFDWDHCRKRFELEVLPSIYNSIKDLGVESSEGAVLHIAWNAYRKGFDDANRN